MERVALTGGIATGKSHVLERFAARHIPTVDADRIARDVVRPGRPAWTAIRERFGSGVFTSEGELDRRQLAATVFDDARARTDLEAIVHPYVRSAIAQWFERCERDVAARFAVADIPLLFETAQASSYDRVIVTACTTETQVRRLMERDGLSAEDAHKRLAAQLPTADKVAQADFVIRTDGPYEDTDRQVEDVCQTLNTEPR